MAGLAKLAPQHRVAHHNQLAACPTDHKSTIVIYPNTTLLVDDYAGCTESIILPSTVRLSTLTVTQANNVPLETKLQVEKYAVVTRANGHTVEGIVLELDDDKVKLKVTNIGTVIIRKYESITMNSYGPKLTITNADKQDRVKLTYEVDGLSWQATMNLYLGNVASRISIAALINNDTNSVYSGEVILLAGQMVNQRAYRARAPQSQMVYAAAAPSSDSGEATGSGLDNYITYDKIGSKAIAGQEIIQLDSVVVNTTQIYVHEINGENTQFGYEMTSPIRLPAGIVRVLYEDRLLGAAAIEQTNSKQVRELLLGDSSEVKITTVVVKRPIDEPNFLKTFPVEYRSGYDQKRISYPPNERWMLYENTINCTIANYSRKPARIYMRYYRGEEVIIVNNYSPELGITSPYKTNYQQFAISMPAGHSLTFSFTLIVLGR